MQLGAVKKPKTKHQVNLTLVPNTFIAEPIQRELARKNQSVKQLLQTNFANAPVTIEAVDNTTGDVLVYEVPAEQALSRNWINSSTEVAGKTINNKALLIGGAAALALIILLTGGK